MTGNTINSDVTMGGGDASRGVIDCEKKDVVE